MLALWLPFNYHSSHAGLIVFALVYGFVSGSFVSLLMPCVAKTGSIETLGRRFGTYQMIVSIAYVSPILLPYHLTLTSNLTGLPIMGAILDRQGITEFSGLILFSGVSALIGAAFLFVATYILGRRLSTWKV